MKPYKNLEEWVAKILYHDLHTAVINETTKDRERERDRDREGERERERER
jgi:hypothetical protein